MEERWRKLGEVLVHYSTAVKPGERVMIAMVEVESLPLVKAVYEATVKAGGYPQVQFSSETLRHLLLKYGHEEQISWVPELEAYSMEWADVYFGLRGFRNPHELWDVPPERLSINQAAMGKISALRWEKTRWCLVRVPNAALAQQAGVDEETLMEMFFNACLIDWERESKRWEALVNKLNQARWVRVVGRNTDLTFSVEGRKWVPFMGHKNMPDGEIATAPVENTVDGHIYFEFPGVLSGRLVEDIYLRWENGRLVEATASSHQDFLRAILSSDPGASCIGEFGIGTNPYINLFCKDILLDEKMGGTVHLALGRAYPECGGTNMSAIHWDIIKDLRNEGAVYVDDQPILKNGVILA